jgi:Fic family protein
MTKPAAEATFKAIEAIARQHPDGITAQQIARALTFNLPLRTLQYRLKQLVDTKRLFKERTGRWTKYRPTPPQENRQDIPLSVAGTEIQAYVRQSVATRAPAGYNRPFFESYRPNVTAYLSENERVHLREVGTPAPGQQPAGTYAKRILSRLLIDLSWNSSRLEGNTYSLLDTKRLIEFGEEAQGKDRLEAQMILNHKDAIEFLVGSAEDIGFNRYTILNLHALLGNNLLADATAAGRLRYIPIGIELSVFHPLEVPQLIEECFDRLLATTATVADPFEQAFFVMVQLPYLQPFDDVNKRVSRLAANIPLIKGNLSPLSFIDVPRTTYTDAMLGVYERNKVDLLKDVFIWAYERSAARYAAVRQSLGEPDSFQMRHRQALREIVREVVLGRMNRKTALAYIGAWAASNIDADERERFRDLAENELLGMHEGNFARYRLTPSEFAAWQRVWA